MRRRATLLICIAALSGAASALELGGALPGGLSPGEIIPRVREAGRNTLDTVRERSRFVRETLDGLRDAVGRPILDPRDPAQPIERAPDGTLAVRGEILASAPAPGAEAVWEAEGLTVARRDTLDPLGIEIVVLKTRTGETGSAALARLRAADPAGSYDLNHLYDPSSAAVAAGGVALTPPGAACDGCRIGVIDSGVDTEHRALRRTEIEEQAFAGKAAVPSAHGTAVASILATAAHGADLYVADVYGGLAEGGSAEAIARALAWLATEQTPVVTMSLAGPPNAVLERAVAAMVARGHLIVAAVGNGGPAAAAAYPAAYPGVIGVTAIDATGRPAIDAQRGPQVAFAAYGVDLEVAKIGGGVVTETGTSFAAPRVAARFAALMPGIGPARAAAALTALESEAVDLGAPGRDDVFGYGALETLAMTAASHP